MRFPLLFLTLLAAPALAAADAEIFHGWSKDGSWLVYEVHGANELDELFFCATNSELRPSWPSILNDMDREDLNGLSCAHFMDPNKAPYQWKTQLVLPAPAFKGGGLEVSKELAVDGESPGFVLIAGDKKQACYASGVREDSKLLKVYVQAAGRFVAAIIDGSFRHCVVTIKGAAAAAPSNPRPPRRR